MKEDSAIRSGDFDVPQKKRRGRQEGGKPDKRRKY